ncbi:MAG: class I SAM-dependent methyltransferase [Nitrosomonadales bacterium]|nr:class I SAM-dependent methyltransferase [Nitrosomonadales bacterium]
MDKAYKLIRSGRVFEGGAHLRDILARQRAAMDFYSWEAFARLEAVRHPIKEIMHLCPMTSRSFHKPRGYAGDAVMIDHIYGLGDAKFAPHPATLEGQVYFATMNSASIRAVRFRRDILAKLIDETVKKAGDGQARILSIAAGHLREAELSQAIREKRVGELIAFDQDAESLAVVNHDYAGLNIHPIQGTVRQLIGGKAKYSGLDLVYAAGLFDYLEQPVGKRLVEKMFDMVRPGGKIMIANFTHDIPDAGYMEALMDWWLIYRSPEQVIDLFSGLPQERIGKLEAFYDPDQNIIFATVSKLA